MQMLETVLNAEDTWAVSPSLDYRSFPIRAVLGDVRQSIVAHAERKGLVISGHCDARLPQYLCGDEIKLRQLLQALALTAVRCTDTGVVDISCSLKDGEADTVRFSIRNLASGPVSEEQRKLLEGVSGSFDSRVYGGSDLSLRACKQLIELMGGRIALEAQSGRGCRICVDMPFCEKNCEP